MWWLVGPLPSTMFVYFEVGGIQHTFISMYRCWRCLINIQYFDIIYCFQYRNYRAINLEFTSEVQTKYSQSLSLSLTLCDKGDDVILANKQTKSERERERESRLG